VTSIPIFSNKFILDLATLLFRKSPTIAAFNPSNFPNLFFMVYRSSSAWVGCWCLPSPAFITGIFTNPSTILTVPLSLCLITIKSTFIESIVFMVSIMDSPFLRLLSKGEKLIISALSLFAAISNEVLVLVLGSKNRLITVLPRSVGTFLTSLFDISRKESAFESISFISSRLRLLASSILFLLSIVIPFLLP